MSFFSFMAFHLIWRRAPEREPKAKRFQKFCAGAAHFWFFRSPTPPVRPKIAFGRTGAVKFPAAFGASRGLWSSQVNLTQEHPRWQIGNPTPAFIPRRA